MFRFSNDINSTYITVIKNKFRKIIDDSSIASGEEKIFKLEDERKRLVNALKNAKNAMLTDLNNLICAQHNRGFSLIHEYQKLLEFFIPKVIVNQQLITQTNDEQILSCAEQIVQLKSSIDLISKELEAAHKYVEITIQGHDLNINIIHVEFTAAVKEVKNIMAMESRASSRNSY